MKSLRISITNRCNFKCLYCHREGVKEDMGREMAPEEIKRIAKMCASFGIEKVKITGGEPLIREDVLEVVKAISETSGIREVSMTTNGYHLGGLAPDLKEAGLHRVNVSLDTLNPRTFSRITGNGSLDKVLQGVDSALEAGLVPVKINLLTMTGLNEGEIWDMIEEFSQDGVIIQLIELMDVGGDFFQRHCFKLDDIESELEARAREIRTRRNMHGRRQYQLKDTIVEVVRPMHNTGFCAQCTRMRVTADGYFKPCLMRSDNQVDFQTAMRAGAGDDVLEELFLEAVKRREPYFVRSRLGKGRGFVHAPMQLGV
jgi:cyclic pyranopterin phosphate synthase